MALQGTLETFSVPEVLRLLSSTRKTGMLAIEGDRGHGSVWLGEGSIISARSDHEGTGDVDATLFDLLRFETGEFVFEGDATPDHPVADEVDVEKALGRAEKLLAEWRELQSVVPSLLVGVRLARELSADSVTVTAEQWRALAAVGGGTSAAGLGQRLELGELDTCRRLRDLLEAELVELTDEPVEIDEPVADEVVDDVATSPDMGLTDVDLDDAGADDDRASVLDDDRPQLVDHDLSHEEVESLSSNLAGFVAAQVVETEDDLDDEPTVDLASVESDVSAFVTNGNDFSANEYEYETGTLDEPEISEIPDDPARDFAAGLDEEATDAAADAEIDASPTGVDTPDEFLAQLTNLSPKAAAAIEATAEEAAGRTATDERDEPAAEAAPEGDEEINRNLLLKFLSSTKN